MGIMFDEAEYREKIRAQIEAEERAAAAERKRKVELDQAMNATVQSANREAGWERAGAMAPRPKPDSAAAIIGAALAEQMVAGMPGTLLEDDNLGDGR